MTKMKNGLNIIKSFKGLSLASGFTGTIKSYMEETR